MNILTVLKHCCKIILVSNHLTFTHTLPNALIHGTAKERQKHKKRIIKIRQNNL